MFPRHSYLDPSYTLTVPEDHTAYGVADLVAHALEVYFGRGDASLSDRFVESIIQEALEFGPQLMKTPDDYLLRARIMWAATNALNGMTSHARANSDFTSHAIGHQLSLLHDTPHGASLTIAFPAWMKHMIPRIGPRLEKLGSRLFGDPDSERTIERLEAFFRDLGCPVRLQDIGLDSSNRQNILDLMNRNDCKGKNPDNYIDDSDRAAIIDLMLEA
jgi:alcohol dehydrogenase YqhD (iron-dependent ADH family)